MALAARGSTDANFFIESPSASLLSGVTSASRANDARWRSIHSLKSEFIHSIAELCATRQRKAEKPNRIFISTSHSRLAAIRGGDFAVGFGLTFCAGFLGPNMTINGHTSRISSKIISLSRWPLVSSWHSSSVCPLRRKKSFNNCCANRTSRNSSREARSTQGWFSALLALMFGGEEWRAW